MKLKMMLFGLVALFTGSFAYADVEIFNTDEFIIVIRNPMDENAKIDLYLPDKKDLTVQLSQAVLQQHLNPSGEIKKATFKGEFYKTVQSGEEFVFSSFSIFGYLKETLIMSFRISPVEKESVESRFRLVFDSKDPKSGGSTGVMLAKFATSPQYMIENIKNTRSIRLHQVERCAAMF